MMMKSAAPRVVVGASLEQPSSLQNLPAWNASSDSAKPVAVLICHGMGQQVPFETLASVAERLQAPDATALPVVRHVHFTDKDDKSRTNWLPRAEISVPGPAGEAAREVHVYEAYWAPLTEGVISLTEVVRFLATAGGYGVWRNVTGKPFERWVFGDERRFRIPIRTPLGLLAALLVVLGLVAINTVLTLVLGANTIGIAGEDSFRGPLLPELTVDLLWLLGIVAAVGVLLWLSSRRHDKGVAPGSPGLPTSGGLEKVALYSLIGALAAVVLIAGLMVYHYLKLHKGPAEHFSLSLTGPAPEFPLWVMIVVWGAAVLASLKARSFFVQYLGDVAIYLDSYKVDKFHTVRQQIKAVAYNTACTLYGARVPGADPAAALAYDHVVLVGHSLGLGGNLRHPECHPAPG
jgi:hypothetical protein